MLEQRLKVMPEPICCNSRTLRRLCEESACCRACGRYGPKAGRKYRAQILLVAVAFSVISMIFTIVALVGLGKNGSSVKAIPWAVGEADTPIGTSKVYLGLAYLRFENATGQVIEGSIDNVDCKIPDLCDNCKNAAASTFTPAIMSLVTLIPQLMTDMQRWNRGGDLNCQRVCGGRGA